MTPEPYACSLSPVAAVVYCRISDDREGAGLGVARQEADCRALCEREGWTVERVLVDNDRSAYRGRRRPGFEALVDGLKGGSWDRVVVWHPDRLTRHPKELEALIDLLEATGAHVRSVTAGEYDLTTATGRMTARVVGAVARHESEHKAERTRRKHREMAEAGKDAGGGRPFGFAANRLDLDPAEAALVREAAGRVLDGWSLRAVVIDWTARGVPTVSGRPWSSQVLRRMLCAPRTAGYRQHAGKLHAAVWAPILDDVTWRRLRALLLDPGRRAALAPRAYLLTGGVARCGLCDARLVARPRDDKRRAYVCASPPNFDGCGRIRVLAEPLERDVQHRVLERIDTGRIPQPTGGEVGPLLVELEQTEASIAELADDYYVHRTVTKAQMQSASGLLEAQAAKLRAEIGRAERDRHQPIDADVVEGWWDKPLPVRRGVVLRVLDAVVVGPAVRGRNRYDPGRVEVRWRV